jgi:nicotinamide-nucleotide amidase
VGLVFEWNNKVVVALPGPPRELRPMVEQPLKSYLANRYGVRDNGCAVTLRFVGLGQSRIDQTLEDHVNLPEKLTLATQFADGRVDFTFSLPDDSAESRALLEKLSKDLQTHLGDFIYATDKSTSLEQCVVDLLAKRRETLSVVEIGSGGSVVAAISGGGQQPASVLDAGYVASTSAKMWAMFRDNINSNAKESTKDEVVQLAKLASAQSQSNWVIVIGTRQENDSGVVEVAFRQPNEQIETMRFPLRDNGRSSRSRLTTMVLDQLRRRLQRAETP